MTPETVFIHIRPDACIRGLIGTIIKRFEDTGMRVLEMQVRRKAPEWYAEHGVSIIHTSNVSVGVIASGYGAIAAANWVTNNSNCCLSAPYFEVVTCSSKVKEAAEDFFNPESDVS